jgi:signal transduction histidine kinase
VAKVIFHKKHSILTRLLGSYGDNTRLEQEKARLEAFLTAFPGEYCGWARDGSVVYSQGFCDILGLKQIRTLSDIQAALGPGDAAALEGLCDRLQEEGTAFVITVKNPAETKTYKISGSQGRDLRERDFFDVLWIEDITAQQAAQDSFAAEIQQKGQELEKLKSALDFVPRPLWLRGPRQEITWCNATYCDFLGKSKEEILSDQKEIFGQLRRKKNAPADGVQPGKSLAAQARKQGKPAEARVHSIIKGSRVLLRITETPLSDFDMTLGIAFNITREEELETELKRYQSSTRELLGQLRSAIAIYGNDERLEFYNAAFAQLWSLEEQWLNTQPRLGEIMEKLRETRRLPEQADFRRFKQSWLQMFTGLIDPFEDMLHLPDGTALRMLIVPHSMGGLMMTFEDVTSRLELESSYNTLIAVQKETLDNLAEAVAVYGGDGRLKLWNPAFGRLWNLNPEDLEGEPHISGIAKKMKAFFDPAEWGRREQELIAKGLDRLMHEGRLSRHDGSLVDFITVPLPDGGVLITYTDVTDSVHVENALREKNAALEAAERLKMDFLANVSYQLRTPLNAIMGFNEILDQEYFGPLNQRQKQYTHDMRAASERLLNLINDILDLSTLEAGYLTLERSEVRILSMLEGVTELVRDWARKEKIEVTLSCPKTIGTIIADERRLQQALINLIRNAISFTPSGGQIEIGAARAKDGVRIFVKDSGVGVSPEDRQRIFEPFERARSGSSDARLSKSGAGLGLSLVKNIIALHGGSVDLESLQGQGTTVTLFLPLTAVPTEFRIPTAAHKKEKVG